MKYQTLFIGLLILMIPFLMGCNDLVQPDDKYPVITNWNINPTSLYVTVVGPPDYVLPHIIPVPNPPRVDVTVDIRTYNANQQFTAKVVIERLTRELVYEDPASPTGTTWFEEDYPFDQFGMPVDNPIDDPHGDPTETFIWDGLIGTYVANSGAPPQGVVEIKFFFEPSYFPVFLSDWIFTHPDYPGLTVQVNRYKYNFKVILEDAGGRSDTFKFRLDSII